MHVREVICWGPLDSDDINRALPKASSSHATVSMCVEQTLALQNFSASSDSLTSSRLGCGQTGDPNSLRRI